MWPSFFLFFFNLTIVVAPMCLGVSMCPMPDVRCFNKLTKKPRSCPRVSQLQQQDEDHIPSFPSFQRIPWFSFSQFQGGFSSHRPFKRKPNKQKNPQTLPRVWATSRGFRAARHFSSRKQIDLSPEGEDIRCVCEYPSTGYRSFLVPFREKSVSFDLSSLQQHFFFFLPPDSLKQTINFLFFFLLQASFARPVICSSCCICVTCLKRRKEKHILEGEALVPSVHCEIFLLQFC